MIATSRSGVARLSDKRGPDRMPEPASTLPARSCRRFMGSKRLARYGRYKLSNARPLKLRLAAPNNSTEPLELISCLITPQPPETLTFKRTARLKRRGLQNR